jgi:hypothetical protein
MVVGEAGLLFLSSFFFPVFFGAFVCCEEAAFVLLSFRALLVTIEFFLLHFLCLRALFI